MGFPGGAVVNNLPDSAGYIREGGSIPGLGKKPWNKKWQPATVFLPGTFHGQRGLVGYRLWGHKELDMTKNTHGDKICRDPYRVTFQRTWRLSEWVFAGVSFWVAFIKNARSGFPWWSSGCKSACQCRGHGFDSWSRKTPHATGQLSPCATTTEPTPLSLCCTRKATMRHTCAATGE